MRARGVCVFVRVCVRACVRARVCVRVCMYVCLNFVYVVYLLQADMVEAETCSNRSS